MNPSAPDADPAKMKHLEFVQAVVTRLANNSFLIKGWSLTVAAALLGFAAKEQDWEVCLLSGLVVLAFWYLDSYYLRLERAYRKLYEGIIGEAGSSNRAVPLFSLNARDEYNEVRRRDTTFSNSLVIFYGGLTIVAIAATVITLARQCPR